MISLSAAQRRIWFLQTRDPEDTTLNSCAVFRLRGAFDIGRLRAAVADVVARHEILRSTYCCDGDDEPRRVVRPTAAPAWQEADLRDLATAGRDRRAEVLIRREAGRPFDLTVETPLRCTVIRTGETEYILALVVHAIGWDEQSWEPFCAEVGARYDGRELSPVPVVAAEAESDAGLDHWRDVLTPLPQPVDLPGRIPPAVTATLRTASTRVALPDDLAEQVETFARAAGTTTFAVLLAAYDVLVHRYTAATDFLVCVPASTRPDAPGSGIGYFGNTLLLRSTLDPAAGFDDHVRVVGERVADALQHRRVGIDRVVAELNPERTGGRDGLELLARMEFAVRRSASFGFEGIDAEPMELGNPTTRMPLSLTVVTDPGAARVEIAYQADEFDVRIIERFLAHYLRVLDAAVREPHRRIAELDIFGSRDRDAILELSRGELVDVAPATLVELFERRVAADPDTIAVAAPDADLELSYGELNRRANRLAHNLIRQGIGTEDVVALHMGTSVEFVIGVLAVLKSGAAYLPIDPAYPPDRAEFLLADARPAAVFGIADLRAAESDASDLPDHDPVDAERVRPLRPGHLAYVIYTSGSTGAPKGVPVSHAAIAEHLDGFCAQWDMTAADRLLQSSSVGFDASLLDVFVTLTLGACLVVPKPDAFDDIPYVAEVISRCGVTVLHMVPSLLSTLLMLPEIHHWRALRHVPVGGEALYGEVADRFAGHFDAELRNHYGPTEAVVSSTHFTVEGPQGTRIVPIGYPNRNVHLYLLDERLQLVPTGAAGEIYLGGSQLARGYLHRAGASAERFVADPFTPGGRLYRTGDLARRNGDGELEFLGRADEQVQVRGYRIELAEVQAAVAAHPDVGQCVVAAVSDPAIGSVLAAYVVPAPGVDVVDFDAVRAHAAAVLPRFMIPAAFASIDEIPLTEHGKLDRLALPQPELAGAELFREPGTAVEIRIAEMFGQMFGRERIGADDSFFELGGHSLLAVRLLAWVRTEFGVRIGVRELFGNPTVSGLATRVEVRTAHEAPVEVY
ncbi:non-ribosomal peptide synthetase [Nocardia nova SH22a]|uniref:Non-ribosomal peptide synthetase n=1 Tax=Nocardia nova SH22a TaxID=1415166 RepID=W5TEJ7_9NOCA|nr:non-ribosomal peptide synthetase [Nocardia nova]AHH15671.1 non-ribosomal peptide synthetase [Nocardia nova SH22a]